MTERLTQGSSLRKRFGPKTTNKAEARAQRNYRIRYNSKIKQSYGSKSTFKMFSRQ